MARWPRFFDVANVLASLAEESARRETDLLEFYLRSLRRFGGVVKETETDVLQELRQTRACSATEALPWLVGAARDSTEFDLRNVLAGTVRCLRSDLMALGYVEP